MSEEGVQRSSEAGVSRPRVRSYRDLRAWQRAMELVESVYAATASMPDAERYGLTSQIRRAVISVASNIAEGHARQSRADYIRFLRMSRGSLAELATQLECARRLSMMRPAAQLRDLLEETSRVLNALIRALEEKDRS